VKLKFECEHSGSMVVGHFWSMVVGQYMVNSVLKI